jgi:hypothetical protein
MVEHCPKANKPITSKENENGTLDSGYSVHSEFNFSKKEFYWVFVLPGHFAESMLDK